VSLLRWVLLGLVAHRVSRASLALRVCRARWVQKVLRGPLAHKVPRVKTLQCQGLPVLRVSLDHRESRGLRVKILRSQGLRVQKGPPVLRVSRVTLVSLGLQDLRETRGLRAHRVSKVYRVSPAPQALRVISATLGLRVRLAPPGHRVSKVSRA
jgi:hypothetical protein